MPNYTKHLESRIQQRSYRPKDVPIIIEIATETPEGLFVRQKDADQEIRRLKRNKDNLSETEIRNRIEQVNRLSGTFIPWRNGVMVSIYRPCRRREKRELREKQNWHRHNRNRRRPQ